MIYKIYIKITKNIHISIIYKNEPKLFMKMNIYEYIILRFR